MAEFLIRAKDHWDLIKRPWLGKEGDIVVAQEDGFRWGDKERLPLFCLVKIPGLPLEIALKYANPYFINTGIVKPNGDPIYRLNAKFKYRVRVADVPASIRDKIRNTGEVSVAWDTIRVFLRNKETNLDAG